MRLRSFTLWYVYSLVRLLLVRLLLVRLLSKYRPRCSSFASNVQVQASAIDCVMADALTLRCASADRRNVKRVNDQKIKRTKRKRTKE